MEFKDRVKALRNERGISQTQLASELGKGESAVRMWEIGRSKPDADTLIRLAAYFGCTTDYLLGLNDFKNADEMTEYIASTDGLIEQLSHLEPHKKNDLTSLLAVIVHNLQAITDNETEFTNIEDFIDFLIPYSLMIETYGKATREMVNYTTVSHNEVLSIYKEIGALTTYRDEILKIINNQYGTYRNELLSLFEEISSFFEDGDEP